MASSVYGAYAPPPPQSPRRAPALHTLRPPDPLPHPVPVAVAAGPGVPVYRRPLSLSPAAVPPSLSPQGWPGSGHSSPLRSFPLPPFDPHAAARFDAAAAAAAARFDAGAAAAAAAAAVRDAAVAPPALPRHPFGAAGVARDAMEEASAVRLPSGEWGPDPDAVRRIEEDRAARRLEAEEERVREEERRRTERREADEEQRVELAGREGAARDAVVAAEEARVQELAAAEMRQKSAALDRSIATALTRQWRRDNGGGGNDAVLQVKWNLQENRLSGLSMGGLQARPQRRPPAGAEPGPMTLRLASAAVPPPPAALPPLPPAPPLQLLPPGTAVVDAASPPRYAASPPRYAASPPRYVSPRVSATPRVSAAWSAEQNAWYPTPPPAAAPDAAAAACGVCWRRREEIVDGVVVVSWEREVNVRADSAPAAAAAAAAASQSPRRH